MSGSTGKSETHPAFTDLDPRIQNIVGKQLGWLGGRVGKTGPAYTGPFTAPMSGAEENMYNQVAGADFSNDFGAGSELSRTLSGDYLGPNEYLNSYIEAATRPITTQWNEQIVPDITRSASMSGALYGTDYGDLMERAGRDLSTVLGDTTSNIVYQSYGDERNRMMEAAGMAPGQMRAPYEAMNLAQPIARTPRDIEQMERGMAYEEWLRQQGLPYETASYIAQLLSSILGGPAVGTSTQTGESPWTKLIPSTSLGAGFYPGSE